MPTINDKADQATAALLQNASQSLEPVVPDAAQAWGTLTQPFEAALRWPGIGRKAGRQAVEAEEEALLHPKPALAPPPAHPILESTPYKIPEGDAEKFLVNFRNKILPEDRRARRTAQQAIEEGGSPPIPMGEGAPPPRDKRGESGMFNLERHHPGAIEQDYESLMTVAGQHPGTLLKVVNNAEDMAAFMDALGTGMQKTKRTWEQVANAKLNWGDIADIAGKGGLLTDSQLYGVRALAASLGEKTVTLARKIYQGDYSPQTLLQYEESGQQFIAVLGFMKNQTSEVARALAQQRMLAQTLKSRDLLAMEQALEGTAAGGEKNLILEAIGFYRKLDAGLSPGRALLEARTERSPLRAAVEFWKANILSSPVTHAVNIGSSAIALGYENVVRLGAAGIGSLHSGDKVFFGEMGQRLGAGIAGLNMGLRSVARILKDPEYDGAFAHGTRADVHGHGQIPLMFRDSKVLAALGLSEKARMQAGHAATGALRVMRMEDELFKSVAFHSELAGLLTRQGIEAGLTGPALTKHIDEGMLSPPADLYKQAYRHAQQVTYQDRELKGMLGSLARHITGVTQAHPSLSFIIPFISTPANVLAYAIDNSPISPLSARWRDEFQKGGAARDMALTRWVLGLSLYTAAYSLYQQGMITGAGPENPDQRAALERMGWKPNALIINGQVYTYDRLDPFALQISALATAMDRARFARTEESALKHTIDAVLALGENFIDHAFLEGVDRFLDIFAGQGGPSVKSAARYVAQTMQGFVPYSAALATVARSLPEGEHATSLPSKIGFGGEPGEDLGQIFAQTFAFRLPGMYDSLRPKRYWDGSLVIPEAHEAARMLSPVKTGTLRADAASKALAEHGIGVQLPDPYMSLGGISVNLLDFDNGKGLVYDRFIEEVGKARRAAVTEVLAADGFTSATADMKALILDRAIRAGYMAGRKAFVEALPDLDVAPEAKPMARDLKEALKEMGEGDLRFESPQTQRGRKIDLPFMRF